MNDFYDHYECSLDDNDVYWQDINERIDLYEKTEYYDLPDDDLPDDYTSDEYRL